MSPFRIAILWIFMFGAFYKSTASFASIDFLTAKTSKSDKNGKTWPGRNIILEKQIENTMPLDNIDIVSREEWGARPPVDKTKVPSLLPFAIIHHTDMAECFTDADCRKEMQIIQNFHMDSRGWWDIGYNFCVGESGLIYEGRGFNIEGAQAPHYNNISVGICVMGNFTSKVPQDNALTAVKNLLEYAVEEGKLQSNYTLYGHRQVRDTECPGDAFFRVIETWPHWKPGSHIPPQISKK